MDSIGAQLKTARMRKGLSLEEVSQTTRIPVRSLQAIENDDLAAMDSAFFYRSFVNQVAQCVGLNRSSLAAALGEAEQRFPEPLVPGQRGCRVRPDVPGLAPRRPHRLRWILSVGSLAILLGACSTFYKFWESSRIAPNPSANPAAASKPDKPGFPAADAPRVAADALQIKLSALENTWLSLTADGREVFKGTLRAEESKTLEGRQTAQIRTGNAGGVEVVFNGRRLGKLGREGEIRTVVFTKDSYNVLHAELPIALASLIRGVE